MIELAAQTRKTCEQARSMSKPAQTMKYYWQRFQL